MAKRSVKTLTKLGFQGDLLLRVRGTHNEKIPEAKKPIMALEGEATGHNHLIYGGAVMFRDDAMARQAPDNLYIGTVKTGAKGAELRHESRGKLTGDHDTIKLPANSVVELRRQRQSDPDGETRILAD